MRYKENATDIYEKNADFIHEKSTLTKTVGNASEHNHNQSSLRWTSGSDITMDSPEIEEIYNTVIARHGMSIYFYLVFKVLWTPTNRSTYIYSKNKSLYYVNLSGITTNSGVFFLLPGPKLSYWSGLQVKITAFLKTKTQAQEEAKENLASFKGGILIKRSKKFIFWG